MLGIGLSNLEIVMAGGYASGAAGSYFEQFTRTRNVDFEQVLEESVIEGLLGTLFYGASISSIIGGEKE